MASTSPRVFRALITTLCTALLATGLAAVAAEPASAAIEPTYNIVDRPTNGVTADALPTMQINGVVWDQAIAGDAVYAGGQFDKARPAGAAKGANETTVYNLVSYNIRTGVRNAGFTPNVNGRIRAMTLSPDKSRLYIVGAFTAVNGVTRNRVAAFNTSDGSLVTSFAPNASSDVFTVVATSSAVYLGGGFGGVNGIARTRLAAVNPSNGATLAWAPTADSTVQAMVMTPDNSRVIVGGIFSQLNGSTATSIGSLDAANGALYPFATNEVVHNYGNTAGVLSLRTDGTYIYGTAYWFGGTGNFEGFFQSDPYSGVIREMADCHGDTYDVSPMNGIVYIVSHHHDCSNMNGFPDTNPRNRWKRASAFTINPTTTTGHNTAGGYYDFYGQPAPSLIDWFPDVEIGSYTGQNQGGWTTEATSEYLVQGGEFPIINNTGQQGLVRFAIPSLATKKSGPRVGTAASVPTLRGISGTSIRVSWPSNWDRDNLELTYRLYRSDKPNTPILTQARVSEFWNLPTQIFTDTGLTPNTSYYYWVSATDPDGNVVRSVNSSVLTTGTTVVDDSNYSKAVITDGASHYWRLNESAGATSSVDWAAGNDLVLSAGVSLGATGAINGSPDPAATFDGTANGTGGQTTTELGPNTFTAEAWIKTTTTSGGKIVGFGDSQLATSSSYDRHVYMDNAGHIVFGVYPGGVRTVTSAGTYNDGNYHQIVASLSSAGMVLYIDGIREGSDDGTTSAQGYNGYWRVGGDNLNGWPSQPGSNFFAGTIDDVAIYPTALSSTQVRDHYTKSGRAVNLPSAPTDAYGAKVFSDNPSFYWRLNEQAGSTTVADSSESRAPGNAFNGVTFGASSTVAPGTGATFNGSDGTLSSGKTYSNPRNYSEEIWFNTTTNRGGKLIGFGDRPSGYSGNYDRHVYMEDSGQLTYGVYTGQLNIITTPTAYNDGKWHHMVATQNTTDGMKLYVDGALTGTNGQTDAQGYTGYWRVGGDSDWGGSSAFLNGTLDEAAVYPYALTLDQVKNHYFASDAAVNAAPVAAFTSSCTNLSCYFDGSTSSDPDGTIASYSWTFGDTTAGTGSTIPHDYANAGTFTATLTVKDNLGKTTSVSHDVTVTAPPVNQLPTAAFTFTCVERACAFDSSGSSDPEGPIAGYDWVFGDGSVSTEASPNHTFATDDTFTVKLTVRDGAGAQGTVSKPVTVKANVKPNAAFTSSCTNLSCTFDGSTSTDSDGTVASYAWDFGDGATATGATTSHTFTAGTWNVKLTVTDNQGATDFVVHPVTVQAANVSPTAVFTSTTADLKATFNAAGSTDPDGTIASYAWTYGDTTTGSGVNPSHTYTAAGDYDVTLTVTDNRGGTNAITHTVTVTAPANVKPTADFSSTKTDLKVNVDASASTDTDGTIASYAWEYGDGGTGTGKLDSHTYGAAGTFSIKLTVTDNGGLTDSVTKSVTVTAANVKPTAAFSFTTADLKASLDGSGSTDSDGTIASYAWDFGDSTTGSGVTTSHTYAAAGTFQVKLTVTDNKGATDAITKAVTVTAPVSTVAAQDAFTRTGSRWGTADVGGSWSDSSAFSTSGGKGLITAATAGAGPIGTLNSVSALNTTTTAEFSLDKVPNGAGYYFTLSSRKQGTSEYRLRVRVQSDGSVRLLTAVVVGGTETTIKDNVISGLTYVAGDTYKVRFDVSGTGTTTLSGKVWKASASEPAAAQVTGTNTAAGLQSAGSVAVQGYLSGSATNAPVVLKLDNYLVTRN